MGTVVTVTIAADSADQAREAMDKAWAEMDRLIFVFDRRLPGTAVFELNREGRMADPGPEMLEVLDRSREVHDLSGGAFDPTILPLLLTIENTFKAFDRPPDDRALMEELQKVDFAAVSFGAGGVRFGRPGQKISLDGVAKGYIVDAAGAVIRATGIKHALINAGGDVLAIGPSQTGRPWRVAIQDPFDPNGYAGIIHLADRAVATSGTYEVFYDPKQTYHHLLNPKIGRPAAGLVSATTIAPTTAMADAYSTAAFINPNLLLSKTVQGLAITRKNDRIATPEFEKLMA
jgi:thiamine biosynthesis lipoprotein